MGNGNGTFQPGAHYTVPSNANAIMTGDFNGDGRLDLAVGEVGGGDAYEGPGGVSILLGNGDGTFQPAVNNTVATGAASFPDTFYVIADLMTRGTLMAMENLAWRSSRLDESVDVLLGNGDGTLSLAGQPTTNPEANPLVVDVNGDGTDDVLVVDGAGDILYRQGIPGQPGTFEPPVAINPGSPSRDIAWVPKTDRRPAAGQRRRRRRCSLALCLSRRQLRASWIARHRASSRRRVIAADLNGTGWDGLVVRNAGDGTLSLFFSNELGSFATTFNPFLSPVTLFVGLGVSDVAAVEDASGHGIELVVTNELTGQVSIIGDGPAGSSRYPSRSRPGPNCWRSIPATRPR